MKVKSPATIVVNVEVLRINDAPKSVICLINTLHQAGNHVVIVSNKTQTLVDIPHWLHKNGVHWDTLRLHNTNEPDGDTEFTIYCVKELWADGFNVILGIVRSTVLRNALEYIGVPSVALVD